MSLDLNNIKNLIYNPALMQKEILDLMANYENGKYIVSDPNNPFMLLMEASAINASSAVQEANNIIRKKYLSLAKEDEDIYHHFYEDILTNIFCQPAEAVIDFYVPVMDLRNNGVRPDGRDYYEITIPTNSVITVLDTQYCILNDIVIRLYDNGETYVEQLLNPENDLAYNDIGTLSSTIINTKQTTATIFFRTKVKQVSIQTITKNIIVAEGFTQLIPITDEYVFSNIFYKNISTNNVYKPLRKTHSDEYINPNIPCCYISVYDKQLLYRIPDPYIIEGNISGVVKIDIYTSKGNLYEPINKLDTSDFSLKLGDIGKSSSALAASKVTIVCHSQFLVNGGKNAQAFADLKNNLIQQGYVTQNLPITDKQIGTSGELYGYSIIKNLDVLTNREYLALKSLPTFTSKYVYAKQDVFFNTVHLDLKALKTNKYVTITSELVIIKSNAIFKLTNGQVTIADSTITTTLKDMPAVRLIQHMKENTYFYTPYYYFIRNDGLNTLISVYELDIPAINSYRILEKNNNIDVSVNIDRYLIEKTTRGYILYFTVIGNSKFDQLRPDCFYIQAQIALFGGKQSAYFDCGYDKDLGYYFLEIESDMDVNQDDLIKITNGVSDLAVKRVPLTFNITLHLCTRDPAVADITGYLQAEVRTNGVVVLSKERFNVTVGYRYDNIHTNGILTYGKDKYKTYPEDVKEVYKENIYDIDPITGSAFNCNLETDSHGLDFNLKFRKGEVVKDIEGNEVYRYRKGDVILDESGLPVIDTINGLEYFIDICMLELEFAIANTMDYKNYLKETMEILRNYVTVEIPAINNRLLENTKIKYKSYKSASPVFLNFNKVVKSTSYVIRPTIMLYFINTTDIPLDTLETYKTTIGNIINTYLDYTQIKLEQIKNDIKQKVSENIVSVKLEGLDADNSEVIVLDDPNKKLTLGKVLDLNLNNEFVVKYDINIVIVYI